MECSLILCVLQGEGKQRDKGAKEVYDTVLKTVRRMQLSEMHLSVTKTEYTLLSVLHRQIHLGARAFEAIFILFKYLKLSLLELRWFYFSARMWGSVFKNMQSAASYFICICLWMEFTDKGFSKKVYSMVIQEFQKCDLQQGEYICQTIQNTEEKDVSENLFLFWFQVIHMVSELHIPFCTLTSRYLSSFKQQPE